MQHAAFVCVIDRVQNLADIIERARQIERAVAGDQRLERLARDKLHDDEEDVLLLLGRQNGDDIRVIESGEKPRLAQELAEIDALLVRHFERDFLIDPGVFREIDSPEPAAADRRHNLVLANDLAFEKHSWGVYTAGAKGAKVRGCEGARVQGCGAAAVGPCDVG